MANNVDPDQTALLDLGLHSLLRLVHQKIYGKYNILCSYMTPSNTQIMPALVAQLDLHQTGDQEVAGLVPAGSATFFHGD